MDSENSLPEGYTEKLFDDARKLGEMIADGKNLFVVGESMPGGTTTCYGYYGDLGLQSYW